MGSTQFRSDSFLASIRCMKEDLKGNTARVGQGKEAGRHLEGPKESTPPNCLFMMQRQRHHVVIAGTSEEEISCFPTAFKKWNNKPKPSKGPEKPQEQYLPIILFSSKSRRIPDILIDKTCGLTIRAMLSISQCRRYGTACRSRSPEELPPRPLPHPAL